LQPAFFRQPHHHTTHVFARRTLLVDIPPETKQEKPTVEIFDYAAFGVVLID
jgi:hypothetical protein